MIEELVEMFNAKRDYPDSIRLIRFELTEIDKGKYIEDMQLLDIICGKLYKSNYIQAYKDMIHGFDEKDPKNQGRCRNHAAMGIPITGGSTADTQGETYS